MRDVDGQPIAGLRRRFGVFDVLRLELGDVNEAVVLGSDVDEGRR
jgi:hypothetical protein